MTDESEFQTKLIDWLLGQRVDAKTQVTVFRRLLKSIEAIQDVGNNTRRVNLAGSLQGNEVPNATSAAVGLCPGGDLVGIDLHDIDGTPFAHAHFDLDEAVKFHQSLGGVIVEMAKPEGHDVIDPEETEGTKH